MTKNIKLGTLHLMIFPNTTPKLKTDRLLLSEFEDTDKEAVFSYASNPKIAETVTWDAHKTLQDSVAFINFVASRKNFESGKVFVAWAIRLSSDGKAIGSITFSEHSEMSAQIDYALGFSNWNRGIVTEAAKHVISWAFETYPSL